MSAVSTLIPIVERDVHLRMMEPQRDLLQVADLIELCFTETLDSDGFQYLRQVRAMARSSKWMTWMYNLAEQAGNMPVLGYVWEDRGQIMGNVSLIPMDLPAEQRGFLVANVAVHPEHRGRGIAQALTAKAVEYAWRRKAASVWLQVRAENTPAVHLYQKLGFRERARRTTWSAKPDLPSRYGVAGVRLLDRSGSHWRQQQEWLDAWFPPELRWQLTYNASLLAPGLGGLLYRLASFQFVRHWAVERSGRLAGVLSWLEDEARPENMILAAPLNGTADEDALRELLQHARHAIGRSPQLSLNCPADFLPSIFPAAGFFARQTLIWMDLPAGSQPSTVIFV